MDTMRPPGLTRHAVLAAGVRWLALAALGGCACEAQAMKASKEDFAYQDHPREGRRCAGCRQYTPASGADGSCAVVEGIVAADGWCRAYTPRA